MQSFTRLMLIVMLWLGYVNTNQYITVFLQKCYGSCNKKYCNLTTVCRPLNRTSKWSSTHIYFHPGVKLDAPIYIEFIANKRFRTVYRPHMLKIKEELCAQLNGTNHPFFRKFFHINNGNMLDPCPISGHRYIKPQISTYHHFPLVPVGEWRLDYIFTKKNNNSEEVVLSWSDFYEVKPTGAVEF